MKKVLSMVLMAGVSLGAAAFEPTNSVVFGDSLSDIGNLKSISSDPMTPKRMTNGPLNAEVAAGMFGITLTPSLHLVPGAPHGNNYAVVFASALDEDGNEATPDIHLPTQVNAYLSSVAGIADSQTLYSVAMGASDILNSLEIKAQVALIDDKQARKALSQIAKQNLKDAVSSIESQIEKLINAGAEQILVVNSGDIGALPIAGLIRDQTLTLATSNKQIKRAQRLPKIATRLSAKFNKMLARMIDRVERRYDIDLIEYDLHASFADIIDNAEDLGYTQVDSSCISVLVPGYVNPECTDFPIASEFLYWDEFHPTSSVHQKTGMEVYELVLSH